MSGLTPAAPVIQTWDFESAPLPLLNSASYVLNAAHGLGAVPSLTQFTLRCTSVDRNYNPGDEIPLALTADYYSSVTHSITPHISSTTIGISTVGSNTLKISNKITAAHQTIIYSKWALVMRAKK